MDTNELITNRQSELQELYSRMDLTKDLVYLNPYTLMKMDGSKKLERAISVTMNNPAVFANTVIVDLIRAKAQIVVEGMTDTKNHQVESFGNDVFSQADEFLTQKFGLANLWNWLCNHVCLRSIVGARWVTTVVNGEYTIDCLPVDMRWCPYVLGQWAANITFRNASDIQAEYADPDNPKKGVNTTAIQALQGKDIEVRDFWNKLVNEVWINGQMVYTQPNPYGYPPFVIVSPATGFMLRDKGYLAHEAEDLLFLNRGLYNELNRSVSIEQTMGMDVIDPALEQESSTDDLTADPAPKSGQTLKVKKGELHRLVPRGDLNNASMTARQDIDKAVQNGGFNDIDTGNVSQTVSAVWITEQSSIRSKFEEPRLQALASFMQQSHRMLIDQAIKAVPGQSLAAGKTGKKTNYNISAFGDPKSYTISYTYMTKSKKQEIANLAMAEGARGTLPLKTILTDILQAEDPDGIIRELELEQARQADPAIGLFEMALRYAEEADNLDGPDADAKKIQSMMLTERGCFIIKQRMQPQVLPQEAATPTLEQSKANSKALMPLLGARGGM